LEEKTDKQLYKEFLDGNKTSFEGIVIRHKDNIIYFIQKYVKNIDVAEDIAQDVFVYILIHKEKYDFTYSLKTYLYIIAKSKAINYIKREKKFTCIEEEKCSDLEELEEKIFYKERARNLKETIKKLKPEYQSAIFLADIEELPYKEICKILNKNIGQVKILIYRARKALSELIRKEESKYEG